MKCTGEVDEAVTHEEEHGQDGSNVIQVPNQDSKLTDACKGREGEVR